MKGNISNWFKSEEKRPQRRVISWVLVVVLIIVILLLLLRQCSFATQETSETSDEASAHDSILPTIYFNGNDGYSNGDYNNSDFNKDGYGNGGYLNGDNNNSGYGNSDYNNSDPYNYGHGDGCNNGYGHESGGHGSNGYGSSDYSNSGYGNSGLSDGHGNSGYDNGAGFGHQPVNNYDDGPYGSTPENNNSESAENGLHTAGSICDVPDNAIENRHPSSVHDQEPKKDQNLDNIDFT